MVSAQSIGKLQLEAIRKHSAIETPYLYFLHILIYTFTPEKSPMFLNNYHIEDCCDWLLSG